MSAFYEHWLTLEHTQRMETLKRMAQEGMGERSIAQATGLNVRFVRGMLANHREPSRRAASVTHAGPLLGTPASDHFPLETTG